MEIKAKVSQLIEEGKLGKAIEECRRWAGESQSTVVRNQLSLLKSKYNQVKMQTNIGMVEYADAMREQLSVANALLELLDQHGEEAKEEATASLPAGNTILFLASNPSDTARLQLEKEFVRISRNLQEGGHLFRLVSEWAVTTEALQMAILKHKPRVIHFSGHGSGPSSGSKAGRAAGFSEEEEADGIILQDKEGRSKKVSGKALEQLFSIFSKRFEIEAVVFNACYSEEQARAASRHVPYVVGMKRSIKDEAAIEFSYGFYLGLAMENDVELAFSLARNKILLDGFGEEEVPVLFTHS